MPAPDPTAPRAIVRAGQAAFAAAVLLLAAMAAAVLWAAFTGPFEPPPRPAAASPGPPPPPPPPVPVRRRPPDQAKPLHDAVRAAYQAGKLREEDVLGAVHALYHEFGTDEARTLAADLEQMIGSGGQTP